MMWRKSVFAVTAACVFTLPLSAYSGEYDDFEDSHPLRIIAYPVHAVGYTLEWLFTRPIHTLVSQPDLVPVFGHEENDFSFENRPVGVLPTGSMNPPAALAPVASTADLDAERFATEARTAAEEAKRAAAAAEQAAERSTRAFDRSLLK
jgi:hypothetical protein